jgi:hypothetical protein
MMECLTACLTAKAHCPVLLHTGSCTPHPQFNSPLSDVSDGPRSMAILTTTMVTAIAPQALPTAKVINKNIFNFKMYQDLAY